MKLEKKHWIMLIAGVVILFLVYWFFFRKKKIESGYDRRTTATGTKGCPCGDPKFGVYSIQCCNKNAAARLAIAGNDDKGWCCKHAFPCTAGNWIKCGGATSESSFKADAGIGVGVGPQPALNVACGAGKDFCYKCIEVDSQGNCTKSVLGCCNKSTGKWLGSAPMGFQ